MPPFIFSEPLLSCMTGQQYHAGLRYAEPPGHPECTLLEVQDCHRCPCGYAIGMMIWISTLTH